MSVGTLIALPAGFLGLPSLHSIIPALAGGVFGALASALVPSFLKHGTVATIQQLVALPDPASWTHVGALQSEMTYLGAMLAPVTLAVGALRYWAVGLTGSAHPVSAVTRCAGATAGLVTYRWVVEEVVAATNTLTHGILGLPSVAGGLQRIIGVLFGGALLSGAGGVFGAFLVIIGVVFAAGLFAVQVLLTVVLALLIVVGPPLIALAAIPELSHLARAWRDALLAVALIPLGWTVLFATAGALCLDATSFTGGAGGLPGHVAAAFAGLITFVLAVRLPFVLLGGVRALFSHGSVRGNSTPSAPSVPSGDRVTRARTRLRSVGLEAVPAFGASMGRAAGALGAPPGGPIGAARRSLRRTIGGEGPGPRTSRRTSASPTGTSPAGGGARERLREAGVILRAAPGEAMRSARARPKSASYPSERGKPEPRPRRAPKASATSAVTSPPPAPVQRPAAPSAARRAPGRAGEPASKAPATAAMPIASVPKPPVPRSASAPTPPRKPEMNAAHESKRETVRRDVARERPPSNPGSTAQNRATGASPQGRAPASKAPGAKPSTRPRNAPRRGRKGRGR